MQIPTNQAFIPGLTFTVFPNDEFTAYKLHSRAVRFRYDFSR